ncbi:acetyl-CoA C-acetyltransferase [Thermonema rossianum]|uniref:acetyl-CoA C-acetyltransferase n=1 Tax=Thermonema rossianum TaxID=55505 RepID=UPI00056DF2A1|nr:acetyl-CoA C-acetyltransferase [Thermonema rossianum]
MDVYIYEALRTPRGKGKPDGALHATQPVHLLTTLLCELRERLQFNTAEIDDFIAGCVTPIGEQGADIARTAVLAAGYAETVTGVQINRFCSSGLEAINMAAAYIAAGQAQLMIAGGVESMSRVPMGSDGGALFTSPEIVGELQIVPQGISADLIATKYGYDRRQLDAFAVESHKRAAKAWAEGYFKRSVVPVKDILGHVVLDKDETVRPDTSLEIMSTLPPSFAMMGQMAGLDALAIEKYPEIERIEHVHHAGNSSGIVDGAAVVLLGNKAMGEKLGLKPRARIKAFTTCGSEPTIMLTGPIPATEKLLKRTGMQISDIDLFEVNEAFAVVPMLYMDTFNIPRDKVNVNGGAIAMGHPLGATGAILLNTLVDELERRQLGTGLVTLCIGGGMGIATLVEMV